MTTKIFEIDGLPNFLKYIHTYTYIQTLFSSQKGLKRIHDNIFGKDKNQYQTPTHAGAKL